MSNRKGVKIRFFDNPKDQVIQNWLDDVPKYQYGGHGAIVKAVLFEYARHMGYQSEDKSKVDSSVQEETDGLAEYEYLTKLFPNIFNGEKYSGNLKG